MEGKWDLAGITHLVVVFVASRTLLCPMPSAHSSSDDSIFTSLPPASFGINICPMPSAHSSIDDYIGTSLTAASLDICPMPFAHSSIDGFIGTSLS
jgi:hypothetical protein